MHFVCVRICVSWDLRLLLSVSLSSPGQPGVQGGVHPVLPGRPAEDPRPQDLRSVGGALLFTSCVRCSVHVLGRLRIVLCRQAGANEWHFSTAQRSVTLRM